MTADSLKPTFFHEVKSGLSAAHVGVQLVIDGLKEGSIEEAEVLDILSKVQQKIMQSAEQIEKFRDLKSSEN